MTIGEIEQQARLKLLDTYEDNYRFAPTEMFSALRDAMRLTRSVRPESKYVDGLLTGKPLLIDGEEADFIVPDSFPTAIGGKSFTMEQYRKINLNMEDTYREPLVYYVIYQMYLKDDVDTANQTLANAYYQKFSEIVRL